MFLDILNNSQSAAQNIIEGQSNTFDTTYALSGIFLWTIFGFLSSILNCDIQRMIQKNPIFFHLVGVTSFFFLFTVIDTNNSTHISIVWLKTVIVYALFVLMTKSKWYFVLPILILLLIDQTYKKHIQFLKAQTKEEDAASLEELDNTQQITNKYINTMIIVLIFIGTAHYMYLQKIQHKSKFSLYNFFFLAGGCKSIAPNYSRL